MIEGLGFKACWVLLPGALCFAGLSGRAPGISRPWERMNLKLTSACANVKRPQALAKPARRDQQSVPDPLIGLASL